MSKQDYELLAAAIHRGVERAASKQKVHANTVVVAGGIIAQEIALSLSESPLFDRKRFLNACGF